MTFLTKLNLVLEPRARKQFVGIVGLLIVSAFLEALGIGLFFPLIELITHPENVQKYTEHYLTVDISAKINKSNALALAGAAILLVFSIKNAILYFVQVALSRFIFNNQVRLSYNLFRQHLYSNYLDHLSANSPDVIRRINLDSVYVFQNIINPLLSIIAESLVVFILFLVCLPVVASLQMLIVSVVLIAAAAVLLLALRSSMSKYGKEYHQFMSSMIKYVSQAFASFKEVRIMGRENYFSNSYLIDSQRYTAAQRKTYLLTQVPRLVLEVFAVVMLVAFIVVHLLGGGDASQLAPQLAVFSMICLRLVPAAGRIMSGVNLIKYYSPSLDSVCSALVSADKVPTHERLLNSSTTVSSWQSINIQQLSFSYEGGRGVENVSGSFKKGSATAVIGRSGSGKTTFINILLGLIPPRIGEIKLDQETADLGSSTWRTMFGYVPQNIALLDDTIRRNVAFGIPDDEISNEKVNRAIKLAQLDQFISDLKLGIETLVGENGARISGGQKQRIGIARALYNDPEILVFDEATSALDLKTEAEILGVLRGLKRSKTLVLITHRISSIEFCDQVIVFENGRIKSVGSFGEVAKVNQELFNALES